MKVYQSASIAFKKPILHLSNYGKSNHLKVFTSNKCYKVCCKGNPKGGNRNIFQNSGVSSVCYLSESNSPNQPS